jgi:hypothetical protein
MVRVPHVSRLKRWQRTTSRSIDIFTLKPPARHNGVFWLDQEEQMNDSLHVVGRRSLKKIGKDEPM